MPKFAASADHACLSRATWVIIRLGGWNCYYKPPGPITFRRGRLVFVSQALVGEPVAVEETEAGEWLVRYAHVEFGFIDPSGRLRRRKLHEAAAGLWTCGRRCASPTGSTGAQQQPQSTM